MDCGGFCADLLTEGLDFVGMLAKLLLSKAKCKRAIVNRKLLPQRTSSRLGIPSLCRDQYPAVQNSWLLLKVDRHTPAYDKGVAQILSGSRIDDELGIGLDIQPRRENGLVSELENHFRGDSA